MTRRRSTRTATRTDVFAGFHTPAQRPLSSTTHPRRSGPAGLQADVAQLVERNLAKVEVAGSSPVVRSTGRARRLTSTVPSARPGAGSGVGVRRLSGMAASSKAPAVELEVGHHTVRL